MIQEGARKKMRTIIAIVLLAVVAEASWEQSNNYFGSPGVPHFSTHPGHGYGRQRNPFYNSAWYRPYEQQNSFDGAYYNNADWICRNPKTGDTMIITSENVPEATPDRHQWHSHTHYPHENTHTTEYQDTHTTAAPESTSPKNNNESTSPHGGEGLIDIRIGGEEDK